MKTALALVCLALAADAAPMPRIERSGNVSRLIVDGAPFFALGAQVHNSSGWPAVLEDLWPAVHAMHLNTVEAPVYWEDIEPVRGEFHFATVDAIVAQARRENIRLVLLWFGTWKNGSMDYTPAWIKTNPERYPHMLDESGHAVRTLSPLSEANRDADIAAFRALLGHLKDADGDAHTVILVQVENEPGSLGAERDYSPEGNRQFAAAVPDALVRKLGRKPGTWTQVFGPEAAEAFSANAVSTYIDAVAGAGKQVYPLPMYVNVWLREQSNFRRPGESYPSGGATSNMLALWKANTPSLDLIAPDVYVQDADTYMGVLGAYRRADNPLLIPETGGPAFALYEFPAIAAYGTLGFAPFGLDSYWRGGALRENGQAYAVNNRLLASVLPWVLKLRGEGNLQAAIEAPLLTSKVLSFDDFDVLAQFGPVQSSYSGSVARGNAAPVGRVLVGQLAPGEFVILGASARVQFRPRRGAARPHAEFISVEEGEARDGTWKPTRRLNGDETFFGVPLPAEGRVLHVLVEAY